MGVGWWRAVVGWGVLDGCYDGVFSLLKTSVTQLLLHWPQSVSLQSLPLSIAAVSSPSLISGLVAQSNRE